MAIRQLTAAHPYAEIFPIDDGDTLKELAADIKANGQLEKIVRYQGKTLDGRRRERACFKVGLEPKYTDFKGTDAEALAFVVSKNLHRRHLSVTDRAFLAEKISTMKAGDNQHSKANCNKQIPNEVPSNEGTSSKDSLTSVKDAANMVGVSHATVERARTVVTKGTPELQQAAKDGTVTVSDAAAVAEESPDVQREAVEAVKTGKAKTVKKAAKQIKEEKQPDPEEDETPWVDGWGIPITKEAAAAFRNADKFDELVKVLRQAKKMFKDLAELPGGQFLQRGFVSENATSGFRHKGLETCIMNVQDSKPKYTVCPYEYNPHMKHDKKECKTCLGLGWVAAIGKDYLPSKEIMAEIKKAHGVS